MSTNEEPVEYVGQVASPRWIGNGTTAGTYDGKELGRTSNRPGAYDAYEKPSLHMGQLIKPREIKA